MHVSEIHIYPLKSAMGVQPKSADVEPWGLAGDRRWMVVDGADDMVSARTDHRLFLVRSSLSQDGRLCLDAPREPRLVVGASDTPAGDATAGARSRVTLFDHDLEGFACGGAADRWLRRVLHRDDVRLIWCDDPSRRSPNPSFSSAGDSVSYADGYPLLLGTTASLAQLNDWICSDAMERGETASAPLGMDRFRPNLVVDGAAPFEEDGWSRVRVGEVTFRVARGCARCVMTTIDRQALTTSKEPIRTLSRYRRWEGKTWFGVNLIPDLPLGPVHVGDDVTVVG